MIRIASGQGYWGDWPQAPALQVRSGPIDYLVMDYLAEVTMSILQKQRRRDPSAGYATDFVTDLGELLPEIADKAIRVIASAGGVNPRGCAQALLARARQAGLTELKVGIVRGDDVLDRALGRAEPALTMTPLEAELPFESVRQRLTSANVYLGARPIVEALRRGAQIVVTGRCTDTGLALAPMIHALDVAEDDWDALALGTVVGHVLECGAQASGGNFLADWRAVADADRIGFPIAEVHDGGRAVITKHAGLGGLVSAATIKEQLLYEIGDPRCYVTPDGIADFTTIRLREIGPDRVEITDVRGRPAPPTLKVSCVYEAGWKVSGQITYCWPEARARAQAAGQLIRKRVENLLGVDRFQEWLIECVGADACHDGLVERRDEAEEVTLRVSARSNDRAACDALSRELAPMVLTGPPGATGFAGGRPRASEVMAYWSGLVPREAITPEVEILEA